MKVAIVNHLKINNGNKTELVYPISDQEFKNQFEEIFNREDYKLGKVKNGVYVDVGANIGLTSLYFRNNAKKYYAIEPSKQCFEALEINTRDLPIERFNFALWPTNTKQYLFQTAETSTTQTFFSESHSVYKREQVECKRIDTFFEEQGIDHVDVLKIDVESSEYVILPSQSFENVASKIDMIIGEAHYDAMTGAIPQIIPTILKEYGFKTKFTNHKNLIYKLHYTTQGERVKIYEMKTNTMFVSRRIS